MTKKLADQMFKRWVITCKEGDILSETCVYQTLQETKTIYKKFVDLGEITPKDWYVQEVTLGKKYKLEQEPKWKEVTDD